MKLSQSNFNLRSPDSDSVRRISNCYCKIPEKILLNIKHFIIQKIEVEFVSFSSEESLAIEKFGRACVYVCT